MSKASFTVGYRREGVDYVVFGVTSVMPNLNGFLFFTEDGIHHFIEHWEITDNILGNVFFEYTDDEGYLEYYQTAQERPENYVIIDHRMK